MKLLLVFTIIIVNTTVSYAADKTLWETITDTADVKVIDYQDDSIMNSLNEANLNEANLSGKELIQTFDVNDKFIAVIFSYGYELGDAKLAIFDKNMNLVNCFYTGMYHHIGVALKDENVVVFTFGNLDCLAYEYAIDGEYVCCYDMTYTTRLDESQLIHCNICEASDGVYYRSESGKKPKGDDHISYGNYLIRDRGDNDIEVLYEVEPGQKTFDMIFAIVFILFFSAAAVGVFVYMNKKYNRNVDSSSNARYVYKKKY